MVPRRMKKRSDTPHEHQGKGVPVNCFKLMYHRITAGLTTQQLAEKVATTPTRLLELEIGGCGKLRQPKSIGDFCRIEQQTLMTMESALGCSGALVGGQEDDFSTRFIEFWSSRKPGQAPDSETTSGLQSELFKPAAIVFDFDGTLTTNEAPTRTTWEALWVNLGYNVNDCGTLAGRYFSKEITHEQWCALTLEKFKERGLTRNAVVELGGRLNLIKGFAEAIQTIDKQKIPMYVVSGSIWDVIITALGDHSRIFKKIRANIFLYANDGTILDIVGTKYDFEGKGKFVIEVAKELGVPTRQRLHKIHSRIAATRTIPK